MLIIVIIVIRWKSCYVDGVFITRTCHGDRASQSDQTKKEIMRTKEREMEGGREGEMRVRYITRCLMS